MIEYASTKNNPSDLDRILNPLVKKWFYTKFKNYSPTQLYAVMQIHSRKNVLVSAPTGATKTLTAFLSILNELVDNAQKNILEDKIYAIYISPLKALNEDIKFNLITPLKEIEEIAGKKLGIRVAVRTGDTTAYEKSKMLKQPPHILITTPESLGIVLSSAKFIEKFHTVDWCIVDEIHALAENKRGVHLSLSLERLQRLSPHMTRVGLSATIAPLDEIAKYLVGYDGEALRSCLICDVQFVKQMDLKVISPVENLIDVEFNSLFDATYKILNDYIQTHKTTLIFTNTRSATERVINTLKDKYPTNYQKQDPTIGAHHGSLSKEYRHEIEQKLREGKLKVAVSSTSLELGIDIGYIDLVVLLSSPKSVARALQRIGRAGHKMSEISVGRIVVQDRDDLIECALLLKSAIERKIDRIHIPTGALDVLAQQIFGIAIADKIHETELLNMIKNSYSFHNLEYSDFNDVLDYLSGKYISLEDRHIYAKIWRDENTRMIGKRGKISRVLYMTNIGTIPDESFITVKVGEQSVGKIDEGFLEKMKKGDVFVLGGEKYEFMYAKGMVAYVKGSVTRAPTIPSWFSEMLPLSYDLAISIGKFRRLMEDKFNHNLTKEEIINFINEYLYVDRNGANSIYEYFYEQYNYASIPSDRKILVEQTELNGKKYVVFHALYGRRVNDCLSRAIGYAISKAQHKDVEIGISDNGFYLSYESGVNVMNAFKLLRANKLEVVLNAAIEKTEVLSRRFRHCAGRSLMILRNYQGRQKRVGRQQVSSMILLNAVKRISPNFSILKEARREVLEDLMDIKNAKEVISGVENGKIKIKEIRTTLPSPFAFNLVLLGYTDVLRMEDKMDFLRRMHKAVRGRIKT